MKAAAIPAVFLSYASQDAEAARRICDALRAAGVEVWFDQSELRGGDAWDQQIRRQINDCSLFIPLVSANTQARREGYFRLEWKLADDRTHLMAKGTPFLLPVCIDDTKDWDAIVPDSFNVVQWTRLPGGETSAAFCERVKALLGGDVAGSGTRRHFARGGESLAVPAPKRNRRGLARMFAAIAAIVAVSLWQPWRQSTPVPELPAVKSARVAQPLPEARQLVARARMIALDNYNSTADDFAAAEGLIKRALELDANDGELWAVSSLFNTAIRTRGYDNSPARREAARSHAERALTLAPESIEGRYALGRWQRDNEPDRSVAEQTFKEVLVRSPQHGGALLSLGTLYSRLGRFEDAIGMFERAGRDPAGMPLARYNQYLAYFSRSHFDEAERCLRESITSEPSANSVTGLAMVLLTAKGDARAAVQALADLPVANRTEHRAVWISAQAHLAAGEPEKALTALSRLSADFIQDNWFVGPKAYWVGRAHAQAGRLGAARIAFESGLSVIEAKLKVGGENASLHLARGELLAWLGQADEALREASTVIELSRGRERPWFISPVRIHAALGRAEAAVPLLRKLLAESAAHESVGWPLTSALLRVDPLWDKLRGDAGFKALAADSGRETRPAPPPDKSVAVLAFANLSDDKENEYFSDGISEELLTVLQKIPGLRVAARTSAFYFKRKNATAQEIGRTLGVAHLVEGSVRKAGDSVRIAARLSRVATGEQLWSENYTRDLKDVFAVQSELAQTIVEQLRGQLGGAGGPAAKAEIQAQVRAAAIGGTRDFEAHELYLQGKFFLNQFSVESAERAEGLLRRALERDPQFALGWAALARAGWLRSSFGETRRHFDEGFKLAREAADRALKLEPNLAAAHLARFDVQSGYDFDWKGAIESVRRALALAPNDPAAVFSASALAYMLGQKERAVELGREAVALDPVNPRVRVHYAWALSHARRFNESDAEYRRVAELSPAAPWSHAGVAINGILQGRFDAAVAEAEREKPEWARLLALALARSGQGKTAAADEALARLIDAHADVAAFQIAQVYAFRREKDRAFEWLDRARRQRDSGLSWSKADLLLENLHPDPRWPAFMKKLGLADEQLK